MNNLVKVLIGLGSTAALSTGGYFLVDNLSSPRSVGDFLEKKGLRLLNLTQITSSTFDSSSPDYQEWTEKWQSHHSDTTENKFSTITSSNNTVSAENVNKLKEECKKVLNTSLEDKDGLEKKKQQAEKWCAVNRA